MLMRGDQAKQLVNKYLGKHLGPGEKSALAALHSPEDLYNPDNHSQLQAVIRPGPIMQRAIDSNPALEHNRQIILQRLTGGGSPNAPATSTESKAIARAAVGMSPAAQVSLAEGTRRGQSTKQVQDAMKAQASLAAPGLIGWYERLGGGAADTALGVGPGLINLGIGEYHDPVGTTKQLGAGMYQNYKNIVSHPLREGNQNPFNFINSTFGLAAGGAGAVGRVGALADALSGVTRAAANETALTGMINDTAQEWEAARAAGDMPRLRDADRRINALYQQRDHVRAQKGKPDFGEAARSVMFGPRPGFKVVQHGNVRVVIPASKSAIGRGLQDVRNEGIHIAGKKILPSLSERISEPGTFTKIGRVPLTGSLGAAGRFGRMIGKQARLEQDVAGSMGVHVMSHHSGPTVPARIVNLLGGQDRAALRSKKAATRMTHAEQAMMSPEAAKIWGLAAGNHVIDLHKAMWEMGKEDARDVPGRTVAIREPKYQDIKHENWNSEHKIFQNFSRIRVGKEGAERAAAALRGEREATAPVRHVPEAVWKALEPFNPAGGKGDVMLRNVDRATQLIRAGRFLHPGYLGWAVQNGMLHLSQSGMFALRNAWQLKHHYGQWSKEAQAAAESGVGAGMARATEGEIGDPMAGTDTGSRMGPIDAHSRHITNALGKFWHSVDDRVPRLMSLIHEMNREGYHTPAQQEALLTGKTGYHQDMRTAVFQRARNEAIDYSAMTPTERATLKRLMTAYGWTRGATGFTARFPLEHPVQHQVLSAVGASGSNTVNHYYAQHGGMPPDWLKTMLPFGHHGWLAESSLLNPSETPARLAEETPGVTKGSSSNLISEASPVLGGLTELATGRNTFGNAFRGNERVSGPITDTLRRFNPLGVLTTAGKKSGQGTMAGGRESAILKELGIPVTRLNDPDKTAALGQKDFEQSLSRGDLIKFRASDHIARVPRERAAIEKATGTKISDNFVGKYKGAVTTVEHIQQAQLKAAQDSGAKTYHSLQPEQKIQAAINYLQQHGHRPGEVQQMKISANQMLQQLNAAPDANTRSQLQKAVESFASSLWQVADGGASTIVSSWKSGVTPFSKNTTPTKAGVIK
jgi:hypothetical protein